MASFIAANGGAGGADSASEVSRAMPLSPSANKPQAPMPAQATRGLWNSSCHNTRQSRTGFERGVAANEGCRICETTRDRIRSS